jgi:hypothetical protein
LLEVTLANAVRDILPYTAGLELALLGNRRNLDLLLWCVVISRCIGKDGTIVAPDA